MASRRKLLWAAVAVAFVLAVISATAEGGFRRYLRLSRDVQSLREKNARLQAKNAQLAVEIEALRTDRSAQEQAAREELGFIRPGEMIFAMETPRAARAVSPPSAAASSSQKGEPAAARGGRK